MFTEFKPLHNMTGFKGLKKCFFIIYNNNITYRTCSQIDALLNFFPKKLRIFFFGYFWKKYLPAE